ncbi:esterase/lipase family protein [Corynebacterium lubricantis]|uniref:esterase/lipase family protein n=1 Tax=Corynebacterium lubricantis TaxID=541095 RepID=UPI0003634072|nr:alpha/beta fold hydrolase [Corynebacterium lubricantis]
MSDFLRAVTAVTWRYGIPPAILQPKNSVGRPIFNNPHFRPTHPTPVLLVHGRTDNSRHWYWAARNLQRSGFSVWAYDYGTNSNSLLSLVPGVYGLGDLESAAQELAGQVERVKKETGAPQVDIVAHSQGAALVKLYTGELGGAANLRRVVTLGATFHGSTLGGLAQRLAPLVRRVPRLARWLASEGGVQQLVGSEFVDKLDALPNTHPDLIYTSIYTTLDRAATPSSTSHLATTTPADVANVDIARRFDLDRPVTHGGLITRIVSVKLIYWGLTRPRGETRPPFADK